MARKRGKHTSYFRNYVISQLADDTILFIKNTEQQPKLLKLTGTFSDASGLNLNLQKCEVMLIHNSLFHQCAIFQLEKKQNSSE